MYRDPITDTCERIMIILSSLAMMIVISVYYLYITVKGAVMSLKFKLMRAHCSCKFFALKVLMYIYYKYLWGCLYTWGFRGETLESRKASLQASIDKAQYVNDPQVVKAVADARDVLRSLD